MDKKTIEINGHTFSTETVEVNSETLLNISECCTSHREASHLPSYYDVHQLVLGVAGFPKGPYQFRDTIRDVSATVISARYGRLDRNGRRASGFLGIQLRAMPRYERGLHFDWALTVGQRRVMVKKDGTFNLTKLWSAASELQSVVEDAVEDQRKEREQIQVASARRWALKDTLERSHAEALVPRPLMGGIGFEVLSVTDNNVVDIKLHNLTEQQVMFLGDIVNAWKTLEVQMDDK